MTAVEQFASWAPRYGLEASDLGRVITLLGTPWRVVGLMPPALSRRFPVLLSCVEADGHVEAFALHVVRAALGRVRDLERQAAAAKQHPRHRRGRR